MTGVRLDVRGLDHLTVIGLRAYLSAQSGFTVLPEQQRNEADVVVVALDELSPKGIGLLRRTTAELGKPIVLIVNEVTKAELLVAVECQVVAILPRASSTDDRLLHHIQSTATGGTHIPPNLLGQLLRQTERLQRDLIAGHGLNPAGLKFREVAVLRLMSKGLNTAEIAAELKYSERTVKNILYTVTNRLQLRNRAHAVAYAMRAGVI